MASRNLGRVGFVPKGEYVPATTYVKYDIVSYNGSNYVAQAGSTGVTPGTDATKWKLFIDNSAAAQAATAANAAAVAANNAATSAANATSYIAPVESSSTAAHAYAVGEQLIYNGALYRAKAAISIGDTLATTGAGANITTVSGGVAGEIDQLQKEVTVIIAAMSDDIIENRFITSDGTLSSTTNYNCTTYLDVSKIIGNTLTLSCTVYGNASAVFCDSNKTVLAYINGSNAASYGITAAGRIQTFTITKPVGTYYVRLSAIQADYTEPADLSVMGFGIQSITDRLDTIESDITDIETDINTLETNVTGIQTDVLTLKRNSAEDEPIIINMFDYFFTSGGIALSNLVTNDSTADSQYLVVNGTQGSTTVTVDETSVLTIADLYTYACGGIIEYANGVLEPVSVLVVDGAVTVYPALSQDAVKAKIYSEAVSIHLSTAGYKYYANCLAKQNIKYTRKRKAIAQYNPFISGEANPMTKIGTYWWGSGNGNIRMGDQRVKVNGTTRFLNCSFVTGATEQNPKGFEWQVNLSGKNGYVEMYVGGKSGSGIDGDFDTGLDFIIEFYVDGVLADTYIKHSKKFEPVRFDFSNAQTGKIKLYTTGGASTHQANVSQITWWETDEADGAVFDPYTVPCLLMDSWGVYHNNAFATQLQENLTAQMNGMDAKVINHSLGSQTSAWGVENFYELSFAEHPNYSVSDFQINDINTGMTEANYIVNMKNLINASLATGITPVMLMQAHATTQGNYSTYTFPFIRAITELAT